MATTIAYRVNGDFSDDPELVALPWANCIYWGEFQHSNQDVRARNLVNLNGGHAYNALLHGENFDRMDFSTHTQIPTNTQGNFTLAQVVRLDETVRLSQSWSQSPRTASNFVSNQRGLSINLINSVATSGTADQFRMFADGHGAGGINLTAPVYTRIADWTLILLRRSTGGEMYGRAASVHYDVSGTATQDVGDRPGTALIDLGGDRANSPPLDMAFTAMFDRALPDGDLGLLVEAIRRRMTKAGVIFGI